jgi:hypothetical protein
MNLNAAEGITMKHMKSMKMRNLEHSEQACSLHLLDELDAEFQRPNFLPPFMTFMLFMVKFWFFQESN